VLSELASNKFELKSLGISAAKVGAT